MSERPERADDRRSALHAYQVHVEGRLSRALVGSLGWPSRTEPGQSLVRVSAASSDLADFLRSLLGQWSRRRPRDPDPPMSPLVWIILLVIVIPMVGLLAWVIISASIIRIRPGRLGLLLERGRPTDTVLTPGPHFVFTLRRRTVEEYPAVEMAYRSGAPDAATASELEQAGPVLRLTLGDRTVASVPYTVRFRLRTDQLRLVHERFGAAGIFGIVRDESSRAVTAAMGDPAVTVEDVFGPAREKCQETLAAAVRERLRARRHRRHGVRARCRGPGADRRGDPGHRTGSARTRPGAGRGGHPAGARPERRRPAGAGQSRRRGVAIPGDRPAARARPAPGSVAGRRARGRLPDGSA